MSRRMQDAKGRMVACLMCSQGTAYGEESGKVVRQRRIPADSRVDTGQNERVAGERCILIGDFQRVDEPAGHRYDHAPDGWHHPRQARNYGAQATDPLQRLLPSLGRGKFPMSTVIPITRFVVCVSGATRSMCCCALHGFRFLLNDVLGGARQCVRSPIQVYYSHIQGTRLMT